MPCDALRTVRRGGVTLLLEALAAGNGRIDFASPEARDSADRAIPGLAWVGGTVTVVRQRSDDG